MYSGNEGRVREGRERKRKKIETERGEIHTQTEEERKRETAWLPAGRNVWYVKERQTADR